MRRPLVVLVNPWVTDFALYDLWSKPLGLLFLASLLRESGIDVAFIDCLERLKPDVVNSYDGFVPSKEGFYGTGKFPKKVIETPEAYGDFPRRYFRYGIPDEIFLKRASQIPRVPDLIWVSCVMTYWYPGVRMTVEKLRELWPGVPVWLGGIYARLCPDHASANSGADFVFCSSPEDIPDFLEAKFDIALKNRELWKAFSGYPPPAWDLLPASPYRVLLVGVGCPYRCTYCASSNLYPVHSVRPPEVVLNEIYDGLEQGIGDFAFYDDALLMTSWESLKEVLRRVIDEGIKVRFHTPNALHVRALISDRDGRDGVVRLLRDAGFTTIRLGFETSRFRHQRDWGGKTYSDEFKVAVKRLFDHGWTTGEIGAYILCGVPGQTPDEVKASIDFVGELGVLPFISEYSPVPGTPMWQVACETSSFNIREEPLYHNNSFFACRSDYFTYEDMIFLKNYARKVRRELVSTFRASSSERTASSVAEFRPFELLIRSRRDV
ncbi:B12-binding domain-containing radical SAM protein [Thermodesulforhabdus norvegica]|uniref:Radical SAM superfamily enzyme YgiQ, UPF0313 family n=1 Tax=Thermodesulforhabdus norvegica TaxID=39841 RepID=A0A1I4VYC1_9BACT|nr:Radical SAM superfamily enzyme YgiQ, UPF0313 family [Thermodesulforhabdus norvegica]